MFGVSDQLVKLNYLMQNLPLTGKFLSNYNKKVYSLNYDVTTWLFYLELIKV